jgi:arylsulfatase A-like enzyme
MKRLNLIAFLIAGLMAACASATAATPAGKPNLIYILADDLGIADFGCYGGKIIQTPRVDQMAREGLKFTQHYSGSTVCAPTRCVLMTGKHTGHARIRGNSGPDLLPGDVTMAEVLKGAGYTTGVIGKWGLGAAGTTGVPNKQGFDFWYGYLDQRNAHHYYPPFLWRNEGKDLFPGNPKLRTHYSHDLFTKEALKFIDLNREKPFFLYMAYTLSHVDLDVPADSKGPYVGKLGEETPYGKPGGQHYRHEKQPRATFAGMTSRLDRDVGRILDYVKKLGIDDNTLMIFSSDNGPTSAGGADPKFFDGNGGFRGIKRDLYEGGIRMPMIARWPGRIKAGSTTDHISAHWDVLPTFAALAGVKAPSNIDGISFAPTLFGKKAAQKEHDYLYWEFYEKGGKQAVRQGDWKAVRVGLTKNAKAPIELYNLAKDDGEENNLAKANPEVVKRMAAIIKSASAPDPNYSFKLKPRKKSKNKSKGKARKQKKSK